MAKIEKTITLTEKQMRVLEALIRLANDNNSEGEANSAARSACKMLKGYIFNQWKLKSEPEINRTNEPDFKSTRSPSWEGFPGYWEEVFGGGFKSRGRTAYGKVNEERERQARQNKESKNYQEGRTPPGSTKEAKQAPREERAEPHVGSNQDPFADFKKAYTEKAYTESQRDFWRNFTAMSDDEFLKFTRAQRDEKNSNKRTLKCTKCLKDILTGFVGHPGAFTCTECQFRRG